MAHRQQAGRTDGPNGAAVPTEDGKQQSEGEAAAKVETVARAAHTILKNAKASILRVVDVDVASGSGSKLKTTQP